MKHWIVIVEGERFGENIDVDSDEQLKVETDKLKAQDVDFVVDPNW